jgi:dTDP-4-dehydrorhamnose 3,5-epimerase
MPDQVMIEELRRLLVRGDDRGHLVALEGGREVPFEIRRAYFIFDVAADMVRGYHAHHETRQFAVCVSGTCKFALDDGETRRVVELQGRDQGLFIDRLIWHEMYDFSPDCVLLVLASTPYDEADYIRDYEAFLRQVK